MADRADLMVVGQVATLAGGSGLAIVEAIAIAGGRVVAAGSRDDVEGLAGPGTRTIALAPDEVAVPGLTDAHLHLADAAISEQDVDLADAPTLEEGIRLVAAAHLALEDREAWIEGAGWGVDRWAGWPTADDLEGVAPGRRVALWAHDHHALWVSQAALAAAGVTEAIGDPAGGMIRRDLDGRPTGVLHETAARLVTIHIPLPTAEALEDPIERLAGRLLALGVVAVHDPGGLSPFDELPAAFTAYARLSDRGRLGIRVHACLREEQLDAGIAAGIRSGDPLGDPNGRATVGWLKLFADGTLGSRTAAMLEPFAWDGADDRGLWLTEPGRLAQLASRAAEHGLATQIHAIGDAAVRAALDALTPTAGRTELVPRVEHVQLVDPGDLTRFAAAGIAASVQPVHLRSDADQARRLWHERGERFGYPWRSLAESGALLPFGTDAPVERIDPWPGLAMAIARDDSSWETGRPFGPAEALTVDRALRAQCLDAALSAGEKDRGRLVPGHRADLAVIPAAALRVPVEPGGPLATAGPRLVLVDGQVVHEG